MRLALEHDPEKDTGSRKENASKQQKAGDKRATQISGLLTKRFRHRQMIY